MSKWQVWDPKSEWQTNLLTNFHTVEKRKIHSHWKKFREIISLVTSLVKPLLSRIFCQKYVRENSYNFYTVSENLLSHFSEKNFVKALFLLNDLPKCWFHEIFFSESEFLGFLHCALYDAGNLTQKILLVVFSCENQVINFLFKMDFNGRNDLSYGLVPVIIVFEVPLREKGFTKYLDEVNKVANSSRGYVHSVEKQEIYSQRKNISWNQVFSNFFCKNVAFMNFLFFHTVYISCSNSRPCSLHLNT